MRPGTPASLPWSLETTRRGYKINFVAMVEEKIVRPQITTITRLWRPTVLVKTRVWLGCTVSRSHKTWSRSFLLKDFREDRCCALWNGAGAPYTKSIASLELRHKEHNNRS